MTQPPELPLTFRQELAPHLFKALLGGWSCAVVGFAGCGLSNLLRFIAEPRVAQHYLKASNRTFGEYVPTEKPDRSEIPALVDLGPVIKAFKPSATLAQGDAAGALERYVRASQRYAPAEAST